MGGAPGLVGWYARRVRDVLGGEFWGVTAYLLVALIAVLAVLPLAGARDRAARIEPVQEGRPVPRTGPRPAAAPSTPVTGLPGVKDVTGVEDVAGVTTLPDGTGARVVPVAEPSKLAKAMARLCRNPQLEGAGLAPDCESGLVTLSYPEHFPAASNELKEAAKSRLRATLPVLLDALREEDLLEPGSLESIEIRGHADPYARKDPYAANLWRSQQRALALATFLTGDPELPEVDRAALRPLLVASGASFSRPPASCPEPEPGCLDDWRRLEIVLHPFD